MAEGGLLNSWAERLTIEQNHTPRLREMQRIAFRFQRRGKIILSFAQRRTENPAQTLRARSVTAAANTGRPARLTAIATTMGPGPGSLQASQARARAAAPEARPEMR